uniref:AAA+ ATPase domain-containing protein n=1 Tax=Photinus pyralis TaxID=7054 RepID=A0A1Y1K6A1_PHOPY
MPLTAKHLLITGPPGIGKTTLIQKIHVKLKERGIPVIGFYTEELRNQFKRREGFDVVTLDGKRGRLARTSERVLADDPRTCRVGQYYVFPDEFENLVLPMFKDVKETVLVIDEIGKMELFSKKFAQEVRNVFQRTDLCILATVPIKSGGMPLIELLTSNNKVLTVSRDSLNTFC